MSETLLTVEARRKLLFSWDCYESVAEFVADLDALITAVRAEERQQRDELIKTLKWTRDELTWKVDTGGVISVIDALLAKEQP
jgi:hypothetical protein